MANEIPYGYCQCGCGQKTALAQQTSSRHGYVKGQPQRFVLGHGPRTRPRVAGPVFCGCGCGAQLPQARYASTQARFVHGHNARRPAWTRERFEAAVSVDGARGCWIWNGSVRPDGYGEVFINGRLERAHRLAHVLFKGPIADGLIVLHHCDNPPCVNPEHLSVGTKADNTRDMCLKLRQRRKLGPVEIDAIRQCPRTPESRRAAAQAFGVTVGYVRMVQRGESWPHLGGAA